MFIFTQAVYFARTKFHFNFHPKEIPLTTFHDIDQVKIMYEQSQKWNANLQILYLNWK